MFFHYSNVFYRNILLLIEHLQDNFSRAIYGNDISYDTVSTDEELRRELTTYKTREADGKKKWNDQRPFHDRSTCSLA